MKCLLTGSGTDTDCTLVINTTTRALTAVTPVNTVPSRAHRSESHCRGPLRVCFTTFTPGATVPRAVVVSSCCDSFRIELRRSESFSCLLVLGMSFTPVAHALPELIVCSGRIDAAAVEAVDTAPVEPADAALVEPVPTESLIFEALMPTVMSHEVAVPFGVTSAFRPP